jgi:hypothetical protein
MKHDINFFFEIGAIIKLHPPSVIGRYALEKECILVCARVPRQNPNLGSWFGRSIEEFVDLFIDTKTLDRRNRGRQR